MSPRSIDRQRSWWRRSSRRAFAGKVLDRAIAPVMEGLEGRTMLAYTHTVNAPKFTLVGDDTDEHIQVVWLGGNDWQYKVNGSFVGGPFDTGAWQIEIYGNGGNDTIEGSGNLNVDTYGVHDLIDGGPGDDVITGWRGNDTLIGNDGFDTVDYSYRSSSGVNVHLGNNSVSTTGESETISGFEAVLGSNFADTLTGSAGNDRLDGTDGNDSISGLAGDDTLSGDKGNDTLNGGEDQDTINYLYRTTAGVDVDLLTQIVVVSGETDAISSFEHAWGSSFDDTLKGTDYGNSLMGGGGADSLVGLGGKDTIFGDGLNDMVGDGADTLKGDAGDDYLQGDTAQDSLYGNAGNDTLVGGAGTDMIDGGSDDDLANYADRSAGVYLSLNNTLDAGETDNIQSNIESVQGSDHADTIYGSEGSNTIWGGKGDDSLFGLGGDDAIYGGLGIADTFGGNDVINGGTGNDLLMGEDGDDSLLGSTENDTLYGGSGNDTIHGGGGEDVARYNERWRVAGVRVQLDDATLAAGGHELDIVSLTETIYGSAYADTITGGSQADRIDARGGADVIDGGGGNDTVLGGRGNDTILGGAGDDSLTGADDDDSLTGNLGADTMDGGDGRDTVDYGYSAADLVIKLTDTLPDGAGADMDVLSGLEDLLGGSGNDTLIAAGGYVDGRGGVDFMSGADSQSTMLGDGASGESFAFGPGVALDSPLNEYYEQVTVQNGTFTTTAQWGATVIGTVSATDVVVSADVTSPASQFVQLYARYVDSSNNYGARIHNGTAFIIKNNAVTLDVGEASNPPTAINGTMRFEVEGGELRLFLDDVLVASATDASPLPTGVVGFLINRWNESGHPTVSNFSASAAAVQGAIFAPSTGGVPPAAHWVPETGLDSVVAGDFDGDGRDDIAGLDTSSNWRVGLSDGAGGFVLQPLDWLANPEWTSVLVGDFNGDGRVDLAGTTPNVWEVAVSTGSGFQKRTSTIAVAAMTDLNVLDLNGDGRDDLIARDSTGQWHAAVSDGVNLTELEWGQWGSGTLNDVRVGDFNNDGRDDLVGRTATGSLQVALSTGAKFKVHNWGSWADQTWYDVRVGNFDGVGGDDLIGRSTPSSSTWQLALSDGFAFSNQSRSAGMNFEDVLVGDFNADGKDDLLGREPDTRKWHLAATTAGGSFTTSLWVTAPSTLPMSPVTVVGDFTGTARKAAKAFEEVYNNIRYEPYAGLMKGAQATQDTGRGNAWDQAALLIEKLRAAGIEARFALGRIEATYADVQRWLAVKDAVAAEAVLEWAKLNPTDTGTSLTFDHAWVQAWLPGEGGFDWRNIDPSWKFRQLQPGIDISSVSFDEAEYHAQIRRETAYEYYEKKVAEYLKANHPGKSIGDVPYDGPIQARGFTSLPGVALDTATQDGAVYLGAGLLTPDKLPPSEGHRVQIDLMSADGAITHMTAVLDVATDGTRAVNLRYLRTGSGLVPQLIVGGEVRAAGSSVVAEGTNLSLRIAHFDRGDDTSDGVFSYKRKAGQPIAVGWGAGQFSHRRLAEWKGELNELAVHSDNDEASAADYQELLLALAAETYFHEVEIQRQGIASLTGTLFARRNVSSGIMTGDSTLTTPEHGDYRWQLSTPIFSGVMSTDNPNNAFRLWSNSGASDFSTGRMKEVYELSGQNASSLEHQFIEELTNAESISTIKGLQWARSRPTPIPVYVIWKNTSGVVQYRLEETTGSGSPMNWSLLNLSSAAEALIQAAVNDQYTVTVPRENIVLGGWTGAVWIQERSDSTGYLIMGVGETEAHGGAALEFSQLAPVVSTTAHSTAWDVGDPVNVRSGSMSHDEQDVTIPAPGIPLAFARHYESSFEEDRGMGIGWLHTYSHYLTFDPDPATHTKIMWTTSVGNRHEFKKVGSAYVTPDELHGSLSWNGTHYVYREKDGTEFGFNNDGKIKFIRDRNGNELDIDYDANGRIEKVTAEATGTPAQALSFTYTTHGRIKTVSDDTGRTWSFEYDEVVNPDDPAQEDVLLVGTKSPSSAGTPLLEMKYSYYTGGVLHGLMKKIEDVRDAGVHEFEYYPNRRAFRTTDSEGNQEFFSYDLFHNRTIYTNPLGHTSVHDFNADADRDRLVLHWGLDEPHDSNVADGKANDESGLGNHGTIKANSGETKWDNGVMGGALKLSPDDSISDAFDASWTPTAFTVSWWMNPTVINGSATFKITANDDWGAFRFLVTAQGAVEVGTNEATRFTDIPAGTVKAGEWQHFSFTYAAGTGKFYRNGVLIGEKSVATPQAWAKFKIYDVDGAVDDVRVYGRALAPEAIADLMTETEAVRNPDRTATSQVKLRQLVTRTTDELGRSETFDYDAAGNVTRHVSKDAVETRFVYESVFNQLVRTSVTNGPTTSFSHDANGNVTGVVEGTTNLALLRNVSKSSTNGTGFEAEKAVDGAVDSRWESAAGGDQWIYVDLGSSFSVSGVRLVWHAKHYATQYKVQLSNDFNNFTNADAFELYSTSAGDGGIDDLRGLSGTGRYLRIHATASAAARYGLYELEVYGVANAAMNAGLASTTTSSAPEDGAQAVDGKASTAWDAPAGTQWLVKDLGAIVPITGIRLKWDAVKYATAYRVQVGNSETDWTSPILDLQMPANGLHQIDNLAVAGQFVRILCTTANHATGYALQELEIYGPRHVSRNRSVTATSESGTFTKQKAVDGDIAAANRWQSEDTTDEWLQVDLGSTFHVSGARIHWYHSSTPSVTEFFASGYRIQVSNDGTNWNTIYHTANTTGRIHSITSLSGVGRYVRLSMETPAEGVTAYAIRDLEFYAATTTMAYDGKGQLVARTEPKGNVATIAANASADFRTSYTYHPSGQVHTITAHGVREPDGAVATTTHLYNDRGYLTSITDPRQFTTTYAPDLLGNPLTTVLPGAGSPTITSTYFNGLLETTTDPRNNTTSFDYDKMERTTRVVNADGTYRTSAYDGLGNLISSTDDLGRTTRFFYDARNRLVQTLRADGTSQFTAYDGAGRVVSQFDPLGNEATFTYEANSDRVKTVTDALGQITTYTYDDLGRLVKEHFEAGGERETTYAVDLLGRVTKTTGPRDPGSSALNYPLSTTLYDAHGNVTSQTRYKIDSPDDTVTSCREDFLDDPEALCDSQKRRTDYEYDAADRRTRELLPDPDGALELARPETLYEYDRAGNVRYVTQVVRQNTGGTTTIILNETEYQYDELGRKTAEILPDPDEPGTGKFAPKTTYFYDVAGNLIGVIGPRGNTTATPDVAYQTTYAYDALNRQISVTSPDPDGLSGTIFTAPVTGSLYDVVGNLVGFTDALGHTTRYEYDMLGRKTRETLPDPDGADPQLAPITTYEYDAAGNLEAVVSPRGHLPGADPTHFTTTYTYDALNRKSTERLPHPTGGPTSDAPLTAWTYKHGQLWKTTDALGRVTELRYDGSGRMIKEILPDPDGAIGSDGRTMTAYEYNSLGELVLMTKPIGFAETLSSNKEEFSTLYEYDALGRKTAETQPDPASNGTADDRPITRYEYDAAGNLWKVISPLGNLPTADAADHTTTYSYDNLGRKLTETLPDPDGSSGPQTAPQTQFEYDEAGNVVKVTDALGRITTHEYDRLERKVKTFEPDVDLGDAADQRPVTRYVYDANGNLTDVIDPLETASDATLFADTPGTIPSLHKTTTTYDALGRKIAETLADADDDPNTSDRPTTLYDYDADGNLSRITDPVGNETTYAYDNLGRKVSETNELGESRTFTYDNVGNVTSITDRNDNVRAFTYDARDRQTHEAWVDPAAAKGVSTVTYDGSQWVTVVTAQPHGFSNGWHVSMAGSDKPEFNGVFPITWISTTSFKYSMGSAPGLTPPASTAGMTATRSERTFTISYTTLGREYRRLEFDAAGTAVHDYRSFYDGLGRVREIFTSVPSYYDSLLSTWDVAGQRTRLTTRIGATNSFINDYAYDNLGRLTKVTQLGLGSGWAEKRVEFNYNTLGQYDTIRRYADIETNVLIATSTYGYDDANRLTSVTHDTEFADDVDYTWMLDAAGRVTHEQVGVNEVVADTSDYTYDNNAQMESLVGDAGGDETYEYDANGNRVTSGHVITADNRLQSDGTYTYLYDHEGNRTRRTHTASGDYVEYSWDRRNRLTLVQSYDDVPGGTDVLTKQVRYTYDPYDRLRTKELDATGNGSFEFIEHYASDGPDRVLTVDGAWAIKYRHLHGVNLDEPLVTEDVSAGMLHWMLPDRVGSVRDIVVDFEALEHVEYGGFGQVLSQDGPGVPLTFGFAGAAYDPDTQLYHHDARWRDPNTNLFLGEDPAKDGSNWFLYARNNPVSFTDPTGLAARNIGGIGPVGSVGQPIISTVGSYGGLPNPTSTWVDREFYDRVNREERAFYDEVMGRNTLDRLRQEERQLLADPLHTLLARERQRELALLRPDIYEQPQRSTYDWSLPQRSGPSPLVALLTSRRGNGRARAAAHVDYVLASAGVDSVSRRVDADNAAAADILFAESYFLGADDPFIQIAGAQFLNTLTGVDLFPMGPVAANSFPGFFGTAAGTLTQDFVFGAALSWFGRFGRGFRAADEVGGFFLSHGDDLHRTGRQVGASEFGSVPSMFGPRSVSLNALNPCFVGGTLVLMADGSAKAIEDVEEGDWVLADDPEDGLAPMAHEVTAWHLNWTEHLTEVFVDSDGDFTPDGSVQATREHPFWTQNRGWVDAQDLQPGDLLLDASGQVSNVTTITSIDAVEPTFNLSVDGVHTFFVMAGGESVLVHNTSPGERRWVVYQANDASGKVYTGRASAPGGLFDDPLDVLRYRYGGLGTEQLRGLDLDNARIIYHAVGNGVGSDAYRATRGLEHLYEQRARAVGMSLNEINPISPSNKNMYAYLAEAYASGVAPC